MPKKVELADAREDVSQLSLHEKLAKIRTMTEVIRKDAQAYNFKYVAEDDIRAHINAGMERYHLNLYPRIVPGTVEIQPYHYTKTKAGKGNAPAITQDINEFIVRGEMVFTWVNLDNPEETLDVPWFFAGQQEDVSQAAGSGLTYLTRYFLLKFFGVATPEDDPDNWRSKKEEVQQKEAKEMLKPIIDDIASVVSGIMSGKSEEEELAVRECVSNIIKKYAVSKNGKPSADYRNVKDIAAAGNLLKELQQLAEGEKAHE